MIKYVQKKKYKRSTAPPRGDPAFQSRPDTFVVIGIGVGTIDRPSYFMLRRVYFFRFKICLGPGIESFLI